MKIIFIFLSFFLLISCGNNKAPDGNTLRIPDHQKTSTIKDTQIPQIYTAGIKQFISSGWLKGITDNYQYHPSKAFDSNPKTVWAEGEADNGEGSYVGFKLEEEIYIDEIRVMPGFFSEKYFGKNNRARSAILYFNENQMKVEFDGTMTDQTIMLDEPESFKTFKFMISTIEKGSESKDTCLSEIAFYLKGRKIDLAWDKNDVETGLTTLLTYETFLNRITVQDEFRTTAYYYDESGKLVKKIEDGIVTIYEYSDSGKIIRETQYFSDGSIYNDKQYEYHDVGANPKNQPAYTIRIKSEQAQITEEYNSKGYQLSFTGIYSTGDYESIQNDVEYDQKGRVIKYVKYNPEGDLSYTDYYEYNNDSEITRITRRWSSDTQVIEFSSNGEIIRDITKDPDGKIIHEILYEEGKIMSDITKDSKGKTIDKTLYTYDNNGFLSKETNYRNDIDINNFFEYKNTSDGYTYQKIELMDENDTKASQVYTYQYKMIVKR